MRALALGGVLQLLRTQKGWSVEQAAHQAGLGHMTWRRVEDGFAVRRRTYAALDTILSLPVGTVQRALNDDTLMLSLLGQVVEVHPLDADDAAGYVERFAHQTLSGSPRQTSALRPAAAAGGQGDGPVAGTLVTAAGDLATRLASIPPGERTPQHDAALRALLDLMPVLLR
jgi:transcriptional regulator with XRE-family HTH domain